MDQFFLNLHASRAEALSCCAPQPHRLAGSAVSRLISRLGSLRRVGCRDLPPCCRAAVSVPWLAWLCRHRLATETLLFSPAVPDTAKFLLSLFPQISKHEPFNDVVVIKQDWPVTIYFYLMICSPGFVGWHNPHCLDCGGNVVGAIKGSRQRPGFPHRYPCFLPAFFLGLGIRPHRQ